MAKQGKPRAVVASTVCSECGLDWKLHKSEADAEVTLHKCIWLLRDELAKAKRAKWQTMTQGSSLISETPMRFYTTGTNVI